MLLSCSVFRKALLVAIAATLAVPPVSASMPKNVSSYVNFQIPHSLYQKGGYLHQSARFGSHWSALAPEGRMVQQLLDLPANDTLLCSDHIEIDPPDQPFALLVDRGNCSYVSKVRNAQILGASGVIIANNLCDCGDSNCTSTSTKCDESPPIMKNDGSGGDISIPSMMLPKNVSDAVKDVMRNKNQPVLVEMAWQVPKFQDAVTMDIWYTPLDKPSMEFLTNFSKLAAVMGDKLHFRPQYSILDGESLNCNGNANNEEDSCYNLCTNNGKYCSISHEGISGKQVVAETLRRLCVSKHYPKESFFWDYIDHFHEWCQSSDFFSNEKCLQDAFKHSKIDKKTIDDCMVDSGDLEKEGKNTLLESVLSNSTKYGIIKTPTILINDAPLLWPLSPKTVLETLCFGFDHGMAPHVCYECATCGDPIACASRKPMKCKAHDGEEKENPSKGSSANKKKGGALKWTFFFLLVAGGGGFVYYKKYMDNGEGIMPYMSLTDAFLSDTA